MSQPLLSICITTYNRPEITCELLSKLYYDARIEYLLVDDGSLAEHVTTVKDFIAFSDLSVTLLEKTNGGKLSALVFALRHASGMYFTDLDSDDIMEKKHIMNMIQGIEEANRLRNENSAIVGICGISETSAGVTFGDSFPSHLKLGSYIAMRLDDQVWGNKVEVILTKVLQNIPVQFFEGEHRIPTNVLWFSLDDRLLLFINLPFETYFPNGHDNITKNIRRIQSTSPNGTRSYHKMILQKKKYYKRNMPYLRAIVNYQRFSWHGAKPFFEKDLPIIDRLLIILSSPLGFALFCWDRFCLKIATIRQL
ncbi:MAG: glycosyltransferase family A protein [Cytophagales bacterium]|nr:glycosyltransferase family A protein [Cytophagales bacterium]